MIGAKAPRTETLARIEQPPPVVFRTRHAILGVHAPRNRWIAFEESVRLAQPSPHGQHPLVADA
jgi:hypothetical protein